MSIVHDYIGLLDTHGDGVSFTTKITGATLITNTPIREEEEEAAAAAPSDRSSESSPARSLPMEVSQVGTVTPVFSITQHHSSIVGSPSNGLEESSDE